MVQWENTSKTEDLTKTSLPFEKLLTIGEFFFHLHFESTKNFEFHLMSAEDVYWRMSNFLESKERNTIRNIKMNFGIQDDPPEQKIYEYSQENPFGN